MPERLNIPEGYSAAVLHTHTTHTDGMVSPRQLIESAAAKGIKVLAITDHDTQSPVEEAQRHGKELGVVVIRGEEIQTSIPRGIHVIGLFLKKPIPHSKPYIWTTEQIREQDGLIIVAHPMVRILRTIPAPTAAMQMGDLEKLVKETKVDGIEIRHRFLTEADTEKLDGFYEQHKNRLGAVIGSSDSHFGSKDMFSYVTLFPGESAIDLFSAIKDQTTITAKGDDVTISLLDFIKQNKRALVDLGYNRYKRMVLRWLSLNLKATDEYVDKNPTNPNKS